MAQFEIKDQKAVLAHIAFPTNSKEDDNKTISVTLKFKIEEHNSWLSNFHPRMATSLYMVDDLETSIEGVEPVRTKRVLGDLLVSINIETELKGASGSIKHGVGDSKIDLELADVKGFNVKLKEGGSIAATFNIAARFSAKHIKTLAELLDHEVTLNVGMDQESLLTED